MHKNKRMVYSVGIAYPVEIVYNWDFGGKHIVRAYH